MEDVPLPRPVACTVPAESADSGGDGGPSSLDQDSGESKFEPAAMMIEVGETEVNVSQQPVSVSEEDFPSDLSGTAVKQEDQFGAWMSAPSYDFDGFTELDCKSRQRPAPAVVEDAGLPPPVLAESADGGEERSSSSVVQDDADIKFQQPVKMEAEEAEFILPDIGPEQCIERDPLELTTSDVKCKDEDAEESAPPLSPEPAATHPIETMEAVRSKAEEQTTRNGDGETVRCPHCDYSCLGPDRLYSHIKSRHGHIGRNGRHQCGWCPYSTDNVTKRIHHRMMHTGELPHRCDVCGKTFTQLCNLTRHHRVQTGQKPYKCDLCGKTFTHKGKLTRHWRFHTGQKPCKCDLCGKAFTQSGGLAKHRRIHTGERPYKCDVCEKSFNESCHLARHRRIHTGERPYKCEVCGKMFADHSTLTAHRLIHSGQRPYKCDVCLKTFTRSNTLTTHRRIHTGEKGRECE